MSDRKEPAGWTKLVCRVFGHRYELRQTFVWGLTVDTCSRCREERFSRV